MKKKTLLLAAVAVGLLATAASCDNTKKPSNPNLEGRQMNVYVNYSNKSGVTFTGKAGEKFTTYTNPVDGKTYQEGDPLPMWEQLAKNLNCQIHDSVWDVDGYTATGTNAQRVKLNDYEKFNELDLIMMSSGDANYFAEKSKLLDLSDYLDHMPNFKKFLQDNPVIKGELTNGDGQIFLVPYFDGLNAAEHLFIMNAELVEAVLDEENTNAFDTAAAKATAYTATIDTSADYKVGISVNNKLQTLTVKKATNPVTAQNDLSTKNGKTYADALRAYIDTAYMHDKAYTKRSEVFTSEKACYTTDDLVALMRVVVNNSEYLKGKFGFAGKVEGFIPREGSDSRIDSVLWLMQIFGVQGIRGMSETDALYYDKNGNLCDGRTTAASYDGLAQLHKLYQEGLIIDGFDSKNGTKYNNGWLTGKQGAALLMFDYNATQTVNNAKDANGIGTDGSKFSKVMPVLPPLTYWENDTITSKDYKYSRYLESSRANKKAGSVIPVHATEEANIAACQLVDYFYSEEGQLLQDYGPEAYRDGTITIGGQTFPKYSSTLIQAVNASGLGWNDYCRMAIGTTQGVGHVRTDGVELQFTNAAGLTGSSNLNSAVASGAVVVATSSRSAGFAACVPTLWSSNVPDEVATRITELTDFWARGTGSSGWRGVVLNGWTGNERTTLEGYFATSNDGYLRHYKTLLELM